MRKSLRLKMAGVLTLFVLSIITVTILASNVFLGDYYLYGKQQSLEQTYREINRIYSGLFGISKAFGDNNSFWNFDESVTEGITDEVSDRFEQIAENRAMSILIFRKTEDIIYDLKTNTTYRYQPIIYSSIGMDTKDKVENNNMYNDFVDSSSQMKVIKQETQYVIQKIYVSRLGSNYLYLSAVLDNGDCLLLRSSYDSMEESVNISMRFICYVSLMMLVIGIFVMFMVTQRVTQPITQLSQIAKKIAELKFDTKYEVRTNDEIGELGNSINYLSESLEKTLGELKSANSQLRKDLEIRNKNDEMRKEFLSNVSHELKTPIALIQGYAEGLMENINDDEESRQFYCEVIVDEANKMNNLVKKLLDLNQLEFGNNTVNMEHFNLIDVIQNYLNSAEILFKQKNVRVETDMPGEVYVWADVYMVEEVFNNYLSNALNHVSKENVIRIKVEEKGKTVRVSVYNSGERIPESDIGHIWDKFYKVDKARTREYGGSGVGLSIVRASMDLLGQKYGVENLEDGVMFYFELEGNNNRPENKT